MTNRLRTLALALIVPALSATAQKTVALPKSDAEYKEPFTQLQSVRELKDGRVVASDSRDKTLQLIDFRSGSATKIGREGSGPGEYAFAGRLVPLPGDTTALYDMLNSRYLLIHPDGKPGKDFRMEEEAAPARGGGRGPGGGIRIGGAQPKGTDARGRIYYEGSALKPTEEGIPIASDSAPILRYDRATHRSDTIAYVHLPPTQIKASGTANNRSVMVSQNPFGLRDDWAVFPDGRVAVARAADYHVDFVSPTGARRSLPAVKYDKLAFTDADKQEWRDARKNATGMMVSNDNGKVTRSVGAPTNIPDPEWPSVKPPFPNNGVFARPNGELWIARSRKAGDPVTTYNVFDAQGKHLGVIALPAKTRLVGFGNSALYAVRIDEDDLQYLQRFRIAEGTLVP